MVTVQDAPMMDATTKELNQQLLTVFIRLRHNGRMLRHLQQKVGQDKILRDNLLEELTRRGVNAKTIELPYGVSSIDELFTKDEPKEPE